MIALVVAAAFATAASATEAEREVLARLVHELEVLETLVSEAERAADLTGRYSFQYPWLREDLTRVRLGIESHLGAPRREPRVFPALRGDYQR